MKQVVEHYASAIIAVLIMLSFSGEFLKQGIEKVVEYYISQDVISENEEFDTYMTQEEIYIRKKTTDTFVVNQQIVLSEHFEAITSSGIRLEVKGRDANEFCFSEAGAYWIHLYAIDSWENVTEVMVKILVNEG